MEKPLTGLEALSEVEEYQPFVIVATSQSKGRVIISMRGHGNGIPKDVVEKIFQPFFTTNHTGQGTGLRLSLSYGIIKALNGSLKAESVVGEGTELIISLPVNT